MDLVQRALVWEARETDLYVNCFFGFAYADAVDAGMTIQAITNGNADLARKVADDVAAFAWRNRKALLTSTRIHSIKQGVALAKASAEKRDTPVVLADHSDRSGYATWLLKEIIAQDLSNTVIATIADANVTAALRERGAKAGDSFDMEVGGLVDQSAGQAVRIKGTLRGAGEGAGQFWGAVDFGRNNVLIVSTYLVQLTEPFGLRNLGVDIAKFDIFAIKSRVHFRRGFDDNRFAKTILLVEPDEPFLGTTRLDGLDYRNLDLKRFYPYGDPVFP
jgi:microcystin degradation protein MlrC